MARCAKHENEKTKNTLAKRVKAEIFIHGRRCGKLEDLSTGWLFGECTGAHKFPVGFVFFFTEEEEG